MAGELARTPVVMIILQEELDGRLTKRDAGVVGQELQTAVSTREDKQEGLDELNEERSRWTLCQNVMRAISGAGWVRSLRRISG